MTTQTREPLLLAPYAMASARSRGRVRPEPPHPYRQPFQRDRDRIVHCESFRRLAFKTQVFTGESGGYHRTRLTHTMEVASIARTLARALRLNEDLVEALALLHDLGHPPFGHAGEDVLNDRLAREGGFSHNAQALRNVELLEQRYPGVPGLNLSIEVLEGQRRRAAGAARYDPGATLEAQVVEAADSIAYDAHDADDALELGLLQFEGLMEEPLWRRSTEGVLARHPGLKGEGLRRAAVHELIEVLVSDVLATTEQRIATLGIETPEGACAAPPVVGVSNALAPAKRSFEGYLFRHVYRHPDVIARRDRFKEALDRLFGLLLKHPAAIPTKYRCELDEVTPSRAVADHLSNLTDRAAIDLLAKLETERGPQPPNEPPA